MTVRLRPHHLLCLLTYAGKGYSPAFTANYDVIAGRISRGETIRIVDGPDDICAPLLAEDEPHCRRASVIERDRLAARNVEALLNTPIRPGAEVELGAELLRDMRAAFAAGRTREACLGCEWSDLCSSIAANTYAGTRVQAAE
jgi:hypothetical protein